MIGRDDVVESLSRAGALGEAFQQLVVAVERRLGQGLPAAARARPG